MSTSFSFPQVSKVVDTLEEKGVTPEILQNSVLGKGLLADLAEAVVRGTVPEREAFRKFLGLLSVVYQLIVDYTMSLSGMVAAGKYDWVNENITDANFPKTTNNTVSVDVELLHFGRNISSEIALSEMKKKGFRPATIWELLDFGAKYPEIQKQFPVIALGSFCVLNDNRHVPFLSWNSSERHLNLDWFDSGWLVYCRFLVVRNEN